MREKSLLNVFWVSVSGRSGSIGTVGYFFHSSLYQ